MKFVLYITINSNLELHIKYSCRRVVKVDKHYAVKERCYTRNIDIDTDRRCLPPAYAEQTRSEPLSLAF